MTDESSDLPNNKAGLDKSFSKGLILLQHLATCDDPAGISDLSVALGMTKSNVHRLLQTLAAYGFVHKNTKSRYSPSLRYWEMGYEVWLHSRAGQVALNDADGLALKANCLVHITLAAEESQELILYDRIGTPIAHPMRRLWPTGTRVPIWRIINGWSDFVAFQIAYIAAKPEVELTSRRDEISRHLEDSGLTYEGLAERVTAARDLGYAENLGSGLENIEGTACAFRDETGAPVGVLSTIYDRDGSRDGRREDTGRLNRLYAHSISRSLGFRDPN